VAAVFFGVYAWHLRGHVAFAFDRGLATRALGFGLPEIPVRWGSWALKVADRLILQHFTSLAVVGVYSVGYSVSKMPFDLVANSIHWAIVPFFYATATRETEARSQALFARVATWNLIILAGLGVGTVIFGGELISILASSKYAEAGAIIPLIVAAGVLEASFYIPSKGIYLKGKTPYLVPLFTVPAALNIGLNFVLIPRFGMMGAAWATLIARALMLTSTLLVSQRIYPIPYEYGTMAKVLVIGCAVAAAGQLVPDTPFLLRVAIKLLLAAAFPGLLYVTGAIDPATLAAIRERLSRYLPGGVNAGSHAG
jgi:O-antigen/teichoic acid export membrane protein